MLFGGSFTGLKLALVPFPEGPTRVPGWNQFQKPYHVWFLSPHPQWYYNRTTGVVYEFASRSISAHCPIARAVRPSNSAIGPYHKHIKGPLSLCRNHAYLRVDHRLATATTKNHRRLGLPLIEKILHGQRSINYHSPIVLVDEVIPDF